MEILGGGVTGAFVQLLQILYGLGIIAVDEGGLALYWLVLIAMSPALMILFGFFLMAVVPEWYVAWKRWKYKKQEERLYF